MTILQTLKTQKAEKLAAQRVLLSDTGDWTDEKQTQLDGVQKELTSLEGRILLLEASEEPEDLTKKAAKLPVDSLDNLIEKTSLSKFLLESIGNVVIADGPEAELRQHFGVPIGQFPLAMLGPKPSTYALQKKRDEQSGTFTLANATTSGPTASEADSDSWIPRVFSKSIVEALGVKTVSKDHGDSLHHEISGGPLPVQVDRSDSVEATPVIGFATKTLTPTRLQVKARINLEDLSRHGSKYEGVVQRDLHAALMHAMGNLVLNGDGMTKTQPGGFLATSARGGLATKTAASTAITYLIGLATLVDYIDGLYAYEQQNVRHILPVDVYKKLDSLVDAGSAVTLREWAMRNFSMVMCDSRIPQASSNIATGIVARGIGMHEPEACVAIWTNALVTRDHTSRASEGEVDINLASFWDFALLRNSTADMYQRSSFKLA